MIVRKKRTREIVGEGETNLPEQAMNPYFQNSSQTRNTSLLRVEKVAERLANERGIDLSRINPYNPENDPGGDQNVISKIRKILGLDKPESGYEDESGELISEEFMQADRNMSDILDPLLESTRGYDKLIELKKIISPGAAAESNACLCKTDVEVIEDIILSLYTTERQKLDNENEEEEPKRKFFRQKPRKRTQKTNLNVNATAQGWLFTHVG